MFRLLGCRVVGFGDVGCENRAVGLYHAFLGFGIWGV